MDENFINLSFLSIVNMDTNQKITSTGSGFYIKFEKHIYFITAKHVAEPNTISYLEIKYEPDDGCKLKPLTGLNYALKTSLNINSEIEDIDIAFIDITENFTEYQAFYQEIDTNSFPPSINTEKEKVVLSMSDDKLNNDSIYTFSGLTRPQIETPPVPHYVYQRILTIENVIFKARDTIKNEILIFTPVNGHRGDDVYEGCSGTPLLDADGNVKAVILSGSEELNEIYAYDINKIKILLEANHIASAYLNNVSE